MALFALAVAIGVGVEVNIQEIPSIDGLELTADMSINKAVAGPARRSYRRTARRTARRTSARYNYYNTLPGGCILQGPYYYCGGVYYQATTYNGAPTYIIVTP
jgi:hypothetical protein